MPSDLPEYREGDLVLVRFEIRRAQPSELDSFLARRPMAGGGWSYHWIPRDAIASLVPRQEP
jgi:hypothetical protein